MKIKTKYKSSKSMNNLGYGIFKFFAL